MMATKIMTDSEIVTTCQRIIDTVDDWSPSVDIALGDLVDEPASVEAWQEGRTDLIACLADGREVRRGADGTVYIAQ